MKSKSQTPRKKIHKLKLCNLIESENSEKESKKKDSSKKRKKISIPSPQKTKSQHFIEENMNVSGDDIIESPQYLRLKSKSGYDAKAIPVKTLELL